MLAAIYLSSDPADVGYAWQPTPRAICPRRLHGCPPASSAMPSQRDNCLYVLHRQPVREVVDPGASDAYAVEHRKSGAVELRGLGGEAPPW
jgi:hypothetical protein